MNEAGLTGNISSSIGNRLSPRMSLAVFAGTHALVDACCAMVVFSLVHIYPLSSAVYLKMIIVYNILAFALQPLCGLLTDRFHIPRIGAFLGIACTGVALVSLLRNPWITVVFAGLGNSLYHVGGGSAALMMRAGKAAPSGYFVAPGALGLAAGALIGARGIPVIWPFAVLLGAAVIAIGMSSFPAFEREYRPVFSSHENRGVILVLLLLVSVSLRSFTGFAAGSLWQGDRVVLYGLVAAAACGKAFGGFLADRFGWLFTGVWALLLSMLFFMTAPANVALLLGGMFLFQMTMPVTLAALYMLFPGKPGLTFGLCCLALIVGAAPVFTPYNSYVQNGTALLSGTLLSTVTLFAGLRLLPKGEESIWHRERRTVSAKESILVNKRRLLCD